MGSARSGLPRRYAIACSRLTSEPLGEAVAVVVVAESLPSLLFALVVVATEGEQGCARFTADGFGGSEQPRGVVIAAFAGRDPRDRFGAQSGAVVVFEFLLEFKAFPRQCRGALWLALTPGLDPRPQRA